MGQKSQSVVTSGSSDSRGYRASKLNCIHVMRLEVTQPRVVLHLLFGLKISD